MAKNRSLMRLCAADSLGSAKSQRPVVEPSRFCCHAAGHLMHAASQSPSSQDAIHQKLATGNFGIGEDKDCRRNLYVGRQRKKPPSSRAHRYGPMRPRSDRQQSMSGDSQASFRSDSVRNTRCLQYWKPKRTYYSDNEKWSTSRSRRQQSWIPGWTGLGRMVNLPLACATHGHMPFLLCRQLRNEKLLTGMRGCRTHEFDRIPLPSG
jgi:hypothetical protein